MTSPAPINSGLTNPETTQPAAQPQGATGLTTALNAAPELGQQPALAVGAAQSQDPAGTAQALSQTTQATSLQQAIAKPEHRGFFGSLMHYAIGDTVGTALKWAAKPLQTVQHEYRYLRDVWARHGVAAFFEAAVPTVLGAAAGSLLGPEGTVLGAELGGWAAPSEGAGYSDSWSRTNDPNYRLNGQQVSVGRDVAHLFGLNPSSGAGKILSGGIDATADWTADPLAVAGRLSAARKAGTWTKDSWLAKQAGIQPWLDRMAPGMAIKSVDQVDQARAAYKGYRNALQNLAGLNAAQVVERYPQLQTAAEQLGAASTADEVHDVFRRIAAGSERADRIDFGTLPSRTTLGIPFHAALAAAQNYSGKGSGLISRASSYLPYVVDRGTNAINSRDFDPLDPASHQAVLRAFKIGLDHQTAMDYLQDFITAPTLAAKKAVYSEGLIEGAKRLAPSLADDPEALERFVHQTRDVVAAPSTMRQYGVGYESGPTVSKVTVPAGESGNYTDDLALWGHQANERWSFPDFRGLLKGSRDLSKWKAVQAYGKLDDVAQTHFTNAWFKPMALLNAGFGLRVALAEGLPEVMRNGVWSTLQSRVAASAAKANYKLADHMLTSPEEFARAEAEGRSVTPLGETNHILAVTAKMMGGLQKLIGDPEKFEFATGVALRTQNHIATGVSDPGHNSFAMPDDPLERAYAMAGHVTSRDARLSYKRTGGWAVMNPSDPTYLPNYLLNVQKASQNVPAQMIAKDLLDGYAEHGEINAQVISRAIQREASRIRGDSVAEMSDSQRAAYEAERDRLARYNVQDSTPFARDRVDDIRNTLTGMNDGFNEGVARQIAGGIKPSMKDVKRLDADLLPAQVAGAQTAPYVGDNLFQRVTTEGFHRVVDPAIRYVSREPMFINAAHPHFQALQDLVDRGMLTEDEQYRIAMRRGSLDMLPQIHNTALRSQLHVLLANYAPFLFAQEQAFRRAGFLVAKRPEALREYMLAQQAINDPGFSHTDSSGNRYLMLPGAGPLGQAIIGLNTGNPFMPTEGGLPLTYNGSVSSLGTVIPEAKLPSAGPLLAIPMNAIAAALPEASPFVKGAVGQQGFRRGVLESLVPSKALQDFWRGLHPSDGDTQYANAYMSALAAAYYHGQVPPADATTQQMHDFMVKMKNNARSIFLARSVIDMITPLSAQAAPEDLGPGGESFSDEWHKLVNQSGSYPVAIQKWISQQGDRALGYTVARSKSTTGANIPDTDKALSFLTSNQALLSSHPNAMSYLAPQGTDSSSDALLVHSEMLQMGLRQRDTPQEFLNAMYAAAGNSRFYNDLAVYENMQARNKADGNHAAESQLYNQWSQYTDALRTANPIWAEQFDGSVKRDQALQTMNEMTDLYQSGKLQQLAQQTPQVQILMPLVEGYYEHQANLAALQASGESQTREKDNWKAYLKAAAQEQPFAANFIQSVLTPLEQHG